MINIAGAVLFFSGAVLAAWSLFIFHKHKTTTTPGKKSAMLVTWGPYKYSRNPMYLSLIFAYLGEAGILSQLWPLVVLPFIIVYINRIVIPLEESKLKEVFGESYLKYCLNVPRWI